MRVCAFAGIMYHECVCVCVFVCVCVCVGLGGEREGVELVGSGHLDTVEVRCAREGVRPHVGERDKVTHLDLGQWELSNDGVQPVARRTEQGRRGIRSD